MTAPKTPPAGRPVRIAILDDYTGSALTLADWSQLEDRAEITVFDRNLGSTEEAIAALGGFDVVSTMRERMPMPRAFFEGLPDLRAVMTTGLRNRTVDLDAAAACGVTVMRTGGSGNGTFATVELAWGLIIAALRDLPAQAAGMRAGAWQTALGQALYGRTLGLAGLGRLGARMVPIARAMGMEVIAWSPNLTEARTAEVGAERVGKEELFARSDVVSLHLVLSERSRGTVGAAEIAAMKPGALLVNTSRGGLVETDPLIAALEAGAIRAAIDVYDLEPLPADHRLRQVPNALLTPHLGYAVEESIGSFYADTVENIHTWLDGAPGRAVTSWD